MNAERQALLATRNELAKIIKASIGNQGPQRVDMAAIREAEALAASVLGEAPTQLTAWPWDLDRSPRHL